MTSTDHCTACKTTKNLLVNSRSTLKSGEFKNYYMCRSCNTERAKSYRATPKGKKAIYGAVYKSTRKHYYKQQARAIVKDHLKRGKISRPDDCTNCGEKVGVEAHHPDYSKPLEVLWLCRPCHSDLHKSLRATTQPLP